MPSPQASRENGKKGGHPKGQKNRRTLEREAVRRDLDLRILCAADRLFHAQLAHAEGCSYLFFRPSKGGRSVLIRDPETIRRYFDGELPRADEKGEAGHYFVATERPSAEAADRLLNRALGKPVESLKHEHTGADGRPIEVRIRVVPSVGERE